MTNGLLLLAFSAVAAMNLASAQARTIYVAPSGDDGGSGALESPRRTIQKAAEVARAGDTILVRTDFVSAGGGHVIRNNLFFGPGRSPIAGKAGPYAAADDLEDKDPLFADAERLDFHLRKGPPAIDAAGTQSRLVTDLEATPRPQGKARDLGAFEHRE